MRAVIDGKRYDTEMATEIATFTNGYSPSNFNYYQEDLYLTHRGRWFLAGEGHAGSPYARAHGDMRGWGHRIIPLTPEQAREWLERNDEIDVLEEHFGEVLEHA